MKLLVVDLLSERYGFGKQGVLNIINELHPDQVFLWAPHTNEHLDYGIGHRIEEPCEADMIIITGSRRNVSSWEPWMDLVANVIRGSRVPMFGICFGHQIIAAALGGIVQRAPEPTEKVERIMFADGSEVHGLFSHQDHVISSGEMLNIAVSESCRHVVHVHPTRPIFSVQFHPETDEKALDIAVLRGEMTTEERQQYTFEFQPMSLAEFFSTDLEHVRHMAS